MTARILVSRNKREGWYAGKVNEMDDWFGTRWESFTWKKQPARRTRTRDEKKRPGWTPFKSMRSYSLDIAGDSTIGSISTVRFVISSGRTVKR